MCRCRSDHRTSNYIRDSAAVVNIRRLLADFLDTFATLTPSHPRTGACLRRFAMRSLVFLFALLCAVPAMADTNVYARRVVISSAQDDAELMATTGVLRHCGRAGGRREGIAFSTVSPDAAIRSCCFYGRYRIVERAVAWSPLRRGWFAVIRYE